MNYGTRNERVALAITGIFNTKISKPVQQFSLDGTLLCEFPSLSEVQRILGFNNAHISSCCNGKLKTAYKYKWKYKNES